MENHVSSAALFDDAALTGDNRVVVVEAAAGGMARATWLEQLAAERGGFFLDVDFGAGGPWAGLRPFLTGLFPALKQNHPELVKRHAAELAYVLPALKSQLGARNQTLTDLAPAEEKVRNYPADRAYRVVHGLIDLLESYKRAAAPAEPWLLVCDHFDRIGHIGRRFFAEWMTRRGDAMDLRFVLAVDEGAGEVAAAAFPRAEVRRQELEEAPAPPLDRAAIEKQAAELEELVGGDKDLIEANVSELLRLYGLLENPRKIFRWQCWGLDTYNSLGFYEDALTYGNKVWSQLDEMKMEEDLRWAIFVKMFMSNIGLQRADEAARLTEESGMLEREDIDRPRRAQLYYLLSMLYVRYFRPRDLDSGERYLDLGLADLEAARPEMTEEDYYFYVVFNRNGLALVRHFQGRFAEAIELCQKGFEQLETHLAGDKHKLHRSVLLYNIGQVYVAIGDAEKGIEYYSKAMEMDPGYSEYFNERAALYLQVGNYTAALQDFLRAIELSPPYPEVWTNLGQCHRKLAAFDAAIEAYSKALDLDPRNLLARVGRGQAYDAMGHADEAFADYSRALEIEPKQWDVLTSRAVLHYFRGDLEPALADLDRAIALAPEQADPYLNRSVALEELKRLDAAAADLRTYLRLAPEAPDRAEAQQRLDAMTVAA